MQLEELIREYLQSGKTRMMQLATAIDGQPWCSTVYYAVDVNLNLIWISTEERRHSREIAVNPKAAGVIAYDQQPPTSFVRGLQFEGTAEQLRDDAEAAACQVYIDQLAREASLLDDIRSGANPHKVYRLTVRKFVLFDSENFPDNPRQEWVKP